MVPVNLLAELIPAIDWSETPDMNSTAKGALTTALQYARRQETRSRRPTEEMVECPTCRQHVYPGLLQDLIIYENGFYEVALCMDCVERVYEFVDPHEGKLD